jgi:hyperosmotically inducible protein
MRIQAGLGVMMLALSASVAAAQDVQRVVPARMATAADVQRKDLQVARDIEKSVVNYAFFTIFDDISAHVDNGVVTLTGKVTQPFKHDDLLERASRVDGVTQVVDHVAVLPVSTFDDQLRYRLARAIYGNSNFWNYAIMANPPIHIVVEGGRVTLTGVVQSNVDRMLARSLATIPGVMSVKIDLKTVQEVRDAGEQS